MSDGRTVLRLRAAYRAPDQQGRTRDGQVEMSPKASATQGRARAGDGQGKAHLRSTLEARGYFHVADRQLVSMLLAVYARTTRVLARPETRRDKRARACRLPAESLRGRGCQLRSCQRERGAKKT